MKTRKQKWVLIILPLILVALFGLLVFQYLRGYRRHRVSIGKPAPVFAEIVTPDPDSSWPMNTPIQIRAAAHSEKPVASMELWINGILVAADTPDDDTIGASSTQEWEWVPGEEGMFSLTLRVTDEQGHTTHSSPVFINATAPAGYRYLVTVGEEDTVDSFAEEYEVDPEAIYRENPDLDPDGQARAGEELFIPMQPELAESDVHVPPMPVSSGAGSSPDLPDLQEAASLSGSASAGSSQGGEPPEGQPPPGEAPDPVAIMQDPDTIIPEEAVSAPPVPSGSGPTAPVVHATIWNTCDILLTWQDVADNELGYLVYGSDVQNPQFELIAELPANKTLFQETMWGQRTFYVSAYNADGESPSDPISISNLDPRCTGSAYMEGGVSVEGGVVQIPDFIQMAYLYASFDGEDWIRIPEDKDAFFPNDGTGYDINELLIERYRQSDKFTNGYAHSSLWADLEVWGWYAGKLYNLGTFKHHSTFSTLRACELAGENACSYDFASFKDEIFISSETAHKEHEFFWYAGGRTAPENVLWQISDQPFDDSALFNPPGLVRSGSSETGGAGSGSFMVDFGTTGEEEERGHSSTLEGFLGSMLGDIQRSFSQSLSQFTAALNGSTSQPDTLSPGTYYVRFLPMTGNEVSGKPSNSVVVSYGERGQHLIENVPEHLPELYTIEVVDWKPPVLVDPAKFGCITIDTAPAGSKYRVGSTICPDRIDDNSRMNWWEQAQYIWVHEGRMIKEGIDTLSEGYEWVKWQMTDFIADTLEFIPLVECNDTCRQVIKTGIETAITSLTGFPPSLPTSEELIDRGLEGALEYGVEYVSSRIGTECGEQCQEWIGEALSTAANEMNNALSEKGPGCVSNEAANAYGYAPLCLPEGVSGTPVHGSTYLPPVATVRITRNDTPAPELTSNDSTRYQANISFGIQNLAREDEYIAICRYWNDYPNDRESLNPSIHLGLKVTTPLTADAWLPEVRSIPWMEPGESIEIPVAPQLAEYYVTRDVHNNALHTREEQACSEYYFSDYDPDWHFKYLYFRGITTISAEIMCEAEDGSLVYCGSADYHEANNPYGPR